jgi:hypothetical protein
MIGLDLSDNPLSSRREVPTPDYNIDVRLILASGIRFVRLQQSSTERRHGNP